MGKNPYAMCNALTRSRRFPSVDCTLAKDVQRASAPGIGDLLRKDVRMRAVTHVMAMAIGLVGAVIAFVVNAMYSLAHVLGRMTGITADRSHFFIGTGLTIVAVIGALCMAGAPEVGAVLLVLATIGFFLI